ncbi:uncharacterized protein [Epargyreus clarus]|uniref:uncharacterized protein n=1 Tax=Epargyreus clarus TaxID=520877 RepID=UPI003C2B5ECB
MTFGKDTTLNWTSFIGSNGNNFLRNMTENRKRLREDDSCEFMPLSKRINNLHINNNLSNSTPQSPESSHLNMNNGITVENGNPSSSSSSDPGRRLSYDPGVTSSQSTYFYENKLLFELHLERIQRSGQQYPY